MIRNFLLLVSFFIFGTAIGQNFEKKVLFTIDNEPVYASEFLSVYNKNLDLVQDNSQRDIDEYLQMFINYKLKVKQAYGLGLDEQESFNREYNSYRNQLAHRFLTDSDVTTKLVHEAYQRSKEEINAAHILIRLNEEAAPADTLEAYRKATEIREKIINGADFHAIAKQFSEDPSVDRNAGELGWFGVFKMVYPFEDAAFRTKVGEISKPVRSRFGYHIIKINDKRKAEGEVTAAHIMISDKTPEAAEQKIYDIYQQLKQGANFEELAQKYSQDKATASKGGKLNTFSAGNLRSPEFEKVAFNLKNPGDISEPVKTEYGWHIIKLINKNSVGNFENMKAQLEREVKKDERSRVITEAFLQNLKKNYNIGNNKESLDFFKNYIGKEIIEGEWKPTNADELKGKVLLSIKDSVVTYKDFADFVAEKQLKPKPVKDKDVLLENWHEVFINDFVLSYHKNNLEKENSEFASVVKEYKEGLLLFDLMDQKIWNKAKQDTIGLKKYYENNSNKYAEDFDKVKGMVINDYQTHLEEEWLKQLRNASEIRIRKKTYKQVKKSIE